MAHGFDHRQEPSANAHDTGQLIKSIQRGFMNRSGRLRLSVFASASAGSSAGAILVIKGLSLAGLAHPELPANCTGLAVCALVSPAQAAHGRRRRVNAAGGVDHSTEPNSSA